MSEQMFDRQWYRRRVADPDTGEQVRYGGGPLTEIDMEFDAAYYGVEFENRRRQTDHRIHSALAGIACLLGLDPEPVPGHQTLNTTAWLELFSVLAEPHNLPSHMDPATAVNFRLDVLRAMAELPASRVRAMVHAMDGYDREETAVLLGYWKSVTAHLQIDGSDIWIEQEIEVPNSDSADRLVRFASSDVRARCGYDVPGGTKRAPKPGALDTSVINDVEAEIAQIRAFRQRELRRRARQEREAA